MDPFPLPAGAAESLLQDAAQRDLTTARRTALLRILLHERWLTREGLMARVEGLLGRNCFGLAAWEDTFYRDMRAVKTALQAAGYALAFSRSARQPGYYLAGQPPLSAEMAEVIYAAAQLDLAQIQAYRERTPAGRFRLGCSTTDTTRLAAALQQRHPQEDTAKLAEAAGEEHILEGALSFASFDRLVLDALEAAGVEYLIGGAVAAWTWGAPRATRNLDLVAEIPLHLVGPLSRELDKRAMLVPVKTILQVLSEARQDLPITAAHLPSGLQAQIYPLRADDELRREAMQRRVQIDLGPPLGMAWLHAPGDLLLTLLRQFCLDSKPQHLRDAAAVLSTSGETLDLDSISTLMSLRGLQAIWQELRTRSKLA